MLSKRRIDEFKAIYLQLYGVALPDAEATEYATSLLSLYKTVYNDPEKMNMSNGHEKKLQPEPD